MRVRSPHPVFVELAMYRHSTASWSVPMSVLLSGAFRDYLLLFLQEITGTCRREAIRS